MTRLMKLFLWTGLLVLNLQCAWGFALLGPIANGGDTYQVNTIGYGLDGDIGAPKNLGEEYRRNTPMLYYSYDANFLDYFGSNGIVAVDKAVAIMNALTNVDTYDYADMSETTNFPFDTRGNNATASAENLLDLKSTALFTLVEQMGLANPVRYTWTLYDRTVETGPAFTNPCPAGIIYTIVQRNFDPITWRPTNVVDNTTYGYQIQDNCNGNPEPEVDAVETTADPDPLSPVASGFGRESGLALGQVYTNLTWDDVGGLRYLLSSNNVIYEDLAPGSTIAAGSSSTITNLADEYTLTTSDLGTLISASSTNSPSALVALYPGLVIASVVTNFNGTFTYTFVNVITNHFSATTTFQLQVQKTTVGPVIGAPVGSPNVTNTTTTTTTVHSNIVSGDFYLYPTNGCGLNVVQTQATNHVTTTNNLGSVTNVSGTHTTVTSTNIVTSSTNYTLLVAPCEYSSGSTGATNSTTGLFQGVQNIKFTRTFFDSLLGQFFQPITNSYKVVLVSGSKLFPETFQRVVTTPDILFSAAAEASGPTVSPPIIVNSFDRDINFDQNNIGSGLAGPGTINPTSKITFDKVGNILLNGGSEDTNAVYTSASQASFFIWGSFDTSSNTPVVYPNNADVQNMESEILNQISPASLSDGTNGVPYPATTFTTIESGFSPAFTWSAPSGLPSGLGISSGGTISGTPTESGTFDVVIQMTDAVSRSVQWTYTLTIH
jgi:hypothetical protein